MNAKFGNQEVFSEFHVVNFVIYQVFFWSQPTCHALKLWLLLYVYSHPTLLSPTLNRIQQKSLKRSAPRVPLTQGSTNQRTLKNDTFKSFKPLGPLWQDQGAEFLKLEKRDIGRMITASKRITSARGERRGIAAALSDVTAIQTLNVEDPDRTTAQMDPNMKLRVDGELAAADEEDDDVPRYRPEARATLGKKFPRFSFN